MQHLFYHPLSDNDHWRNAKRSACAMVIISFFSCFWVDALLLRETGGHEGRTWVDVYCVYEVNEMQFVI